MGRYIDWAAVAGRYPDAAKIAGAESVGSYWLPGVEAEVDARLSRRYTVPFSPPPPMVQDLCIDLTYCRMTVRQEETAPIYERAIALLDALVAGTMPLLTGSGTSLGGTSSSYAWSTNSYRSSFGPDDPEKWSTSQAALDDAAAGREND